MKTELNGRGSAGLAIKAGFWYVISTFLVKGLSFITHPIFAGLLSKEDLGAFSNFASWETLLLIITSLEMQNTVARAYYDFTKDFDKYVSSVTIASCGVTLILYGIALLFSDVFTALTSIPKEYIHVLFIMLLFQGSKQIFMAKERTLYRYKGVAAISAVNALVPTLIAVGMVVLAEKTSTSMLSGRIYGFYIPSTLIGVGCALVLLFKGKGFSWKHCKYGLALSCPLMLHYLTAQLLTSSNSIITTATLGEEANATVSTAASANHIMTTLLLAVSGAVTTWLMDNLNQENIKAVRKGTLLYIAGISALAFGVILLSPEIVYVLGSGKYPESVVLMPGFVVAVLIQSSTTIFTIMLTYQKKVVGTAVWTGIIAVLCVVAKYFLLPWYEQMNPGNGVHILPFINIASFGALFFINYILVCKSGLGKYLNIKGITAILLLIIVFMAASYFLYNHLWLRIGVIAVLCIVAVIAAIKYRKFIIKIVRKKFGKKNKKINSEA